MTKSFIDAVVRTQLMRLGCLQDKADQESASDPLVMFRDAGYRIMVPADDIPVSALPGAMRLDKMAWLACVSVEAAFSADVEDGDLVQPHSAVGARATVWVPANRVDGAIAVDDNLPKIWGIAYKNVGRVMLGPAVFHHTFAFKTGDVVRAGTSGKLLTTGTGPIVGVCVAPGTIYLDLSATFGPFILGDVQDKIAEFGKQVEWFGELIRTFSEKIDSFERRLAEVSRKQALKR